MLTRFPDLELTARIEWMVQCLTTYLPSDYRVAVGIIMTALPPPNDPTRSDGDYGDFIYAPMPGMSPATAAQPSTCGSRWRHCAPAKS